MSQSEMSDQTTNTSPTNTPIQSPKATVEQAPEETKISSPPTSPRAGHLYKFLVIGDAGTGKTSIIQRFVHSTFTQNYRATIGIDFTVKVFDYDKDNPIRLQLWDIAGQERFTSMTRVYYKDAVAALVVFDVTRPATFESVAKWKADIDSKVLMPNGDPIPCVLLANKCDQPKKGPATNSEKIDAFCKEKNFLRWYETSAKVGINVDLAMMDMVGHILENASHYGSISLNYDDQITLSQLLGGNQAPEPERRKKCGC